MGSYESAPVAREHLIHARPGDEEHITEEWKFARTAHSARAHYTANGHLGPVNNWHVCIDYDSFPSIEVRYAGDGGRCVVHFFEGGWHYAGSEFFECKIGDVKMYDMLTAAVAKRHACEGAPAWLKEFPDEVVIYDAAKRLLDERLSKPLPPANPWG